MASFLRTSTLTRLFPALLVAGGFLILWLGVLGDLTVSVDAAWSSSTDLQQISQDGGSCQVGLSSQPTMTYGTVQAGVDDAQAGDEVTVIGTCTGAGIAPIALITKSLTLRSDGNAILEGEGVRRLLYITGDIDVTVENLDLRGGKAIGNGNDGYGGGLYVTTSTVTLRNTLITSNTASNQGGGLYVTTGTLTLNNTSVDNNRASSGGGLYLSNSTAIFKGGSNLAQNQATSGDGGGVLAHHSVMTVTNSSLVTNTAQYNGGALYADNHNIITLRGGSEVAANEAILGTGGAIYANQALITLNGIIVANHVITDHGAALYLDVLEATLKDNVFIQNKSREGSGGALYLKATKAEFSGNLVNNNQAKGNGGGFWLQVGEVILDNNTFLANKSLEGRGGALHLEVTGSREANISGNIINNNEAKIDGGGFSLRNIDDGVLLSNNEFNSNKTLTGNGGALYLYNSNATLNNNNITSNQAQNNGGGLYAHSNSDVTLQNDNELLNNTATSGSGGALYLNSGNATINDSRINGNTAQIHGGGYYANNDANTLEGNTFSGNQAQTGHGGGLYVKGNSAILSENHIEQNTTAGRGGGMYIVEVDARISNSHIIGNEAVFGGGLFLSLDSSIVSKNIITDNKSSRGGGFFLSNSSAKLIKNEIMTNTASDGGGIFLSESNQAEVNENLIAHNIGNSAGGGLYLELSDATIYHNQITTNTIVAATRQPPGIALTPSQEGGTGGALFLTKSDATLEGNTIRANKADNGGALYFDQSQPTAINNIIADNQATMRASALYNVASSPIFLHNTIAHNTGGQNGYALFVTQNVSTPSTLRMTNTILSDHTVALYVEAGNNAILRSSLWYNNSQSNWSGAGTIDTTPNIVANPHFTTTQAGNYRLAANSGAIDVGVNAGIKQDIDLDLRPTVPSQENQTGYDIGADEYDNPKIALSYQAAPNPVFIDQLLTYTILVTNTGNVTLTAAITATLPPGVQYTGATTWITQTLPHKSWSQTIPVTVTGNPRTLTSKAEVTTDKQGVSDSQTVTTEARASQATLAAPFFEPITDTVIAGEVLTYNIIITNTGNVPLNTTITATFPAETSPNAENTWTTTLMVPPNNNFAWSKQISVTFDSQYSGTLISTLQVTTTQGAERTKEALVTVKRREPKLALDASTSAASHLTQEGQQLSYRFSLTNTGNTSLYSPTVTITTMPAGTVSTDTLIITRSSELQPNHSWSGSKTVTVTTKTYKMFTPTAIATAQDTNQIYPLEVTDSKDNYETIEANVIEVSQSATPNPAIPGQKITYTLYVTNTSQVVTLSATIEDQLPAFVTTGSQTLWRDLLITPTKSVSRTVTGNLMSGCLSEPLTNTIKVTTPSEQGVHYQNKESVSVLAESSTITATKSGSWDNESIWQNSSTRNGSRAPSSSDRVYIPRGISVTIPATFSDEIKLESLNNKGTLQSAPGIGIDLNATTFLCNDGEIVAGDLTSRSIHSQDIELDAPTIENRGTITAGAGFTDSVGGSLLLKGNLIINGGYIRAGDGGDSAGGQGNIGGALRILSPAGSILLKESSIIRSGDGGLGSGGGDGGGLSLIAAKITGEGLIQAGNGGESRTKAGGDGGTVKLFGYRDHQCLAEVRLNADIYSGKGQNGGEIYLMAPTLTVNNSQIRAGGVLSSGTFTDRGSIALSNGDNSCVPQPSLSLVGSETTLEGDEITIFGGEKSQLNLSNMRSNAISATGKLLLATGVTGTIDLRGNTSQVMAGQEGVELASNEVLLPTGLTLPVLAGGNASQTTVTNSLLSGVSLVGVEYVVGEPSVPLTGSLTLINRSPQTDTFTLSANAMGSSQTELPESLTLEGGQIKEFPLTITPSLTLQDVIEIQAVSGNAATQNALLKIHLRVIQEGISKLYLPLIHR